MQLSPPAEGLFNELGYSEGDTVAWPLLYPLCDSGDIYTYKSGTDLSQDADQVERALSSGKLSAKEKTRIKAFLAEDDTPEGTDREDEPTGTEQTDVHSLVDDSTKSAIEQWSQSEDEYTATLNRLAGADDPEGIVTSVNQHSTHHPIQPIRFQVSSQGVPVYSFETDGIPWVVHHFDPLTRPTVDASLFIKIRPGTSTAQSITVSPETTDWHTATEYFDTEQIDDFLAVAPDILYYYHYHPNTPDGDPYAILTDPSAKLTDDDEQRVEALDSVREIDLDEYGRAVGVVLSKGDSGHGRLRAHTGHTFSYDSDHIREGTIDVGSAVSFNATKYKHGYRARSIRAEDVDGEASRIIRKWPLFRETDIQNIIVDPPGDGENHPMTELQLTIGSTEVETTTTTVALTQSTQWVLQINDEDPDETVDSAIRTALKASIDGDLPDTVQTDTRGSVNLTLPVKLQTMIESAVSVSEQHDTGADFITAAIESQIDHDDKEVHSEVSSGEDAALEYLADKREQTVDELIRELIQSMLTDAQELTAE
jgi:hypothetical protein